MPCQFIGSMRSGTLICSLKFELINPRVLAPGAYAAVVDLDLRAEGVTDRLSLRSTAPVLDPTGESLGVRFPGAT
jgi:hypothetical protein